MICMLNSTTLWAELDKSQRRKVAHIWAWENSAQLDQYNFSYGEDSINGSVSDSLPCVNYFVKIEDYFGKVLNIKVVEGD